MNKLTRIFMTLCLLAMTATFCHAQTEKGHWMLGLKSSGLGLRIEKGHFGLSIAPDGGYFVVDRLAVGASLGFSYGFLSIGGSTSSNFNLGLAPFLRYYIPFTEKLSFPVNVSFGGGLRWNTGDFYSNSTGIYGSATGGVAFFPNEHLSLDFLAGYSLSRYVSNISPLPVPGSGAIIANWGATWYFAL